MASNPTAVAVLVHLARFAAKRLLAVMAVMAITWGAMALLFFL